ncbi:hypothetical protein ACTFIW_003636 [Dictyostelium discoideum]
MSCRVIDSSANDSTSSSTKFKKVKHLHQQPIIQDGRNKESTIDDVKSEISHWLTVLNQWNGKKISLFQSYDYVLTTDASESGAGATLKKGNKTIKTWSFRRSITQSNMSSNRREMLAMLMAYQALY